MGAQREVSVTTQALGKVLSQSPYVGKFSPHGSDKMIDGSSGMGDRHGLCVATAESVAPPPAVIVEVRPASVAGNKRRRSSEQPMLLPATAASCTADGGMSSSGDTSSSHGGLGLSDGTCMISSLTNSAREFSLSVPLPADVATVERALGYRINRIDAARHGFKVTLLRLADAHTWQVPLSSISEADRLSLLLAAQSRFCAHCGVC